MSLNRDQFIVVLGELRGRVRDGAWVEGEPLTVGDLANDCGVSQTPVREALARLAGEGLVEDRRGRGYYARRIDGAELADLYRAQKIFGRVALANGLSRPGSRDQPYVCSPADFLTSPVGAWEGLYEGLLRRTNSVLLTQQQRRLADLLAPARRVEPLVLGETDADFGPLVAALASSDWAEVEAALEPLAQRRRAAVDDLVISMRLAAEKYKISI
ncbi:MAG TPA: GntR family transcriptional regulator [Caulobacteraceae bacterium]|jgi:DNA-binding transcriptional ArsR family regulator